MGSSESTLVKMPHCGKSHVAAQLYLLHADSGSGQTAWLPRRISHWSIRWFYHTAAVGIIEIDIQCPEVTKEALARTADLESSE